MPKFKCENCHHISPDGTRCNKLNFVIPVSDFGCNRYERAPQGVPYQNQIRNVEMAISVFGGKKYAEVAADYGLSVTAVRNAVGYSLRRCQHPANRNVNASAYEAVRTCGYTLNERRSVSEDILILLHALKKRLLTSNDA